MAILQINIYHLGFNLVQHIQPWSADFSLIMQLNHQLYYVQYMKSFVTVYYPKIKKIFLSNSGALNKREIKHHHLPDIYI